MSVMAMVQHNLMWGDDMNKYCPYCQREIAPYEEDGEIVKTQDGGMIYVHDAVPHDEDYNFEELQW